MFALAKLALRKEMKKSKDQIINHLEGLLKEKTADCMFYAICGNVFLLASIVLGVSLCNMDEKFLEKKDLANSYKERLYYYLDKRIEVRHKERFSRECVRLAHISKRGFSVAKELLSEKDACYYGQTFLYSVKEIEDAIRHYELGTVGAK